MQHGSCVLAGKLANKLAGADPDPTQLKSDERSAVRLITITTSFGGASVCLSFCCLAYLRGMRLAFGPPAAAILGSQLMLQCVIVAIGTVVKGCNKSCNFNC